MEAVHLDVWEVERQNARFANLNSIIYFWQQLTLPPPFEVLSVLRLARLSIVV